MSFIQCQQAVVGQRYFMLGLKHVIGLSAHQDLGVQTQKFSIFVSSRMILGMGLKSREGRMVGFKTRKERIEK